MNNFTPTSLTTQVKWTNSLKNTKDQKLTQEEIENLNRPIQNKEIQLVIKNLPTTKKFSPVA